MIEIRQARYFVAVAEELHFGRAAARLQMSQPPLSQAIIALERQLGATLLERNRRSVALTAAGEVLLSRCRTLLRSAEDAEHATRRAATGRGGAVRIGAVATAFSWPLPEVIERFRRQREDVELRVEEIDTHEAAPKLLERTLDWAIVRQTAATAGTAVAPLLSDEFAAVLPVGHPAAGVADDPARAGAATDVAAAELRAVDLAGFAEETWIWLHRGISPDYHDAMAATCRAAGFSPSATHWARSVTSQIAMVRNGLGVTIVPVSAVLRDPSVRFRRLEGPRAAIGLAAVTRTSPGPLPALLTSLAGDAISS